MKSFAPTLLLAAAIACDAGTAHRGDAGDDDVRPTGDAATNPDADPHRADAGPYRYLCDLDPPPGAQLPPPPPSYSGGACPTLVAGENTITSSGAAREFILVMPEDMVSGEALPLGILWHPLGSDANVFLREGEMQSAIDSERFMAILPQAKGDLTLQWPWNGLDPAARVDEELRFFDDVFACVAEQFDVNLNCVSNGGVSSGGLWAMQVGWRRGEHFASLLSVSGGTGDGSVVKSWSASPHKMPTLVLWGGALDACVVFNFTDTSQTLEAELAGDGHFILECIHNCGHAIPPFDPPPGKARFAPLWEFVMNHPYWLPDGDSPYLDDGLPAGTPEWCGIGPGSSTPRTGTCDMPSEC
jgi:predicted esterase